MIEKDKGENMDNVEKSKTPIYKKWWFYLIVLVVVVAMFSKNEDNVDMTVNNPIQEENSTIQSENKLTKKDSDEKIYEFDDAIDKFLKQYNNIYSDKITSETVSKYYHHGREHDNQIKILNRDFEIIISSTYVNGGNKGISVFIDNINNLSSDEFKNIYKHYTKVYNENLSDEELEEYWNGLTNKGYSDLKKYEDIEFELNYGFDDIVRYVKITGKIK